MSAPASIPPRRFGLTVGGVFALLGVLSRWRGHDLAPLVLWTLAVLLITPAAIAPALLIPIERIWMRGAALLGQVNTRIILTVVYYVLVFPVGVLRRLVHDPLDRALTDGRTSYWTRREAKPVDIDRYRQQF